MIDLCTLGTGGTMPLPDRALASLYVRVGGRAVLVDCGEDANWHTAPVLGHTMY